MSSGADGPLVALAGGVGAARYLSGVVEVVDPRKLTVVVNTGDDAEFYGVHVSPDLDIVTYTLAGVVDPDRGFGLAGDSFHVVEQLARLGHESWFRLGDRDFANCLHRTLALRGGIGLAKVCDDLRRHFGVATRILPMSQDPCPTRVELGNGQRVHFEQYLVRDGAPDDVAAVDLSAARAACPAPGVVEAVAAAGAVLVCPSNPVVSIGPIRAVGGIAAAIDAARVPVVAVSPIVGGAPIKGPADALLRGIGAEVSARGVAALYRDWIDGIVIDERDRAQAAAIEALGLAVEVTDTWMVDGAAAARVARCALSLVERLR